MAPGISVLPCGQGVWLRLRPMAFKMSRTPMPQPPLSEFCVSKGRRRGCVSPGNMSRPLPLSASRGGPGASLSV